MLCFNQYLLFFRESIRYTEGMEQHSSKLFRRYLVMANQTIGERIAQLRRKKNITQEAMAEQLGVTPQAVSKWENGVSQS